MTVSPGGRHCPATWRLFALVSFLAFTVAACGGKQGTPPNVSRGRFVLHIDGAFTGTLSGTARYRTEDGQLTGFELIADVEEQGLSLELEPLPVDVQTYEVIDWELLGTKRSAMPPGFAAFLDARPGSFTAVDGTLHVDYMAEHELGATFTLEMEGTLDGVPGDEATIAVTGDFRAVPTSSNDSNGETSGEL